jgi:hypothetical protein
MVAKSAKPNKRIRPKSVTFYFSEEQRDLYDLIQVTAKQYHQSVSNLCAMSVNMGFPILHDALNTLPLAKDAPVSITKKRIMPMVSSDMLIKRKVKRT